jgi:diguanylate cyclase (GGDEF)-like protein/PAS domain S-box-containing protein
MEPKGADYLASFVDPGPAYDPTTGPPDAFFRGVVEQAAELVIAFGHDGTIAYANDALRVLLGHDPAALVGTNALDLVAPDDLANAAETVHHAAEVEGWRPPRPFRLVHADGRLVTFQVAGLSLFHVPAVRSIVILGRWADDQACVDRVLGLLAAHRPTAQVLAELVHLLERPGWELAVTIQYDDGHGGFAAVSSGGHPELDGLRAVDAGPWAAARATGEPVVDIGLAGVPPDIRADAVAAGYQACWAIPVHDQGGAPACVIVWNREAIEPELGQDLLLQRLLSLVELTLDGRAHAAALERAANCDPLTGLWNRRYLEEAAAAHDGPGALLLCDLDGFKQVNDELGHPAGDAVIRAVADRLTEVVRETDVVARLGGDEFAVLCPGLDALDLVGVIAARIVEAVRRPITHGAAHICVGVSVGAAVAETGSAWRLDDLVHDADERLLAAKADGKSTFRIGVLEGDRRRRQIAG